MSRTPPALFDDDWPINHPDINEEYMSTSLYKPTPADVANGAAPREKVKNAKTPKPKPAR